MKNIPSKSHAPFLLFVFLLCIFLLGAPRGATAEKTTPLTSAVLSSAHEDQVRDDKIFVDAADLLSDTDLSTKRGSGGPSTIVTVSSTQTMSATTSGNTLNVGGNLTNGSIATGTFGGSGFGSYVMNTGNNSTINSGVSLSILMMH